MKWIRGGINAIRAFALYSVRLQGKVLHGHGTDRMARLLYHPERRSNDFENFVGTSEGSLIQIDTRSFLEWSVFVHGGYQRESIELLRYVIQPGATALDVGANIGVFTLSFARAVGPYGSVHSFEPHPLLAARLRTNIALNNLRNVRVNNLALAEVRGRTTLYAPTGANQASASLRPTEGNLRAAEQLECQVGTVDDYVRDMGLQRVDLIKIDVEGAELAVLRGAGRTLAIHRPCIYVEVSPPHLAAFGTTPLELHQVLHTAGYATWRDATTRYGGVRLIAVTATEAAQMRGYRNWLAINLAHNNLS